MTADFVSVATFLVGKHTFGFEHQLHEEILINPALEPLPRGLPWASWYVIHNWRTYPVIDLKEFFQWRVGMVVETTTKGQVALTRVHGQEVGLLVDELYFNQITRAEPDSWFIPTAWYPFIKWVGKFGLDPAYILNLEELLPADHLPSAMNRWDD